MFTTVNEGRYRSGKGNNEITMKEEKITSSRVLVVGLNRSRLLRIMALVANIESSSRNFEYIACVARMSSYEGTRYMSSFILCDGSPINTLFDDDEFRSSLKTVVMVGYGWKDIDGKILRIFFEQSHLSVAIKCVQPNECFSTLTEELNYAKETTADDKTIGPLKMAHFIVNATTLISDDATTTEIVLDEASYLQQNSDQTDGYGEKSSHIMLHQKVNEIVQDQTHKRIIGYIDQNVSRYACRMCRTVVISENHLIIHEPNIHSFHNKSSKKRSQSQSSCQSLFCDEIVLAWLSQEGQDNEGKLACPKCCFKIGTWSWSGSQCSCGTWVVPSIQIPLSKVDRIPAASKATSICPIGMNMST